MSNRANELHSIIYKHHFAFKAMHKGELKTFIAKTQRLPDAGGFVNAYVRELDEIIEVSADSIVCVIKPSAI